MMNYFEVIAKCGHVGRSYYYEGHFYVVAESRKEAAMQVKIAPRVKKHHEDVILNVIKIDNTAYEKGVIREEKNPYKNCNNKQDQQIVWDLIEPYIKPETEKQIIYRKRKVDYSEKSNLKSRNGIRNERKYYKYNIYSHIVFKNQLEEIA